jgi:hypothetical protein
MKSPKDEMTPVNEKSNLNIFFDPTIITFKSNSVEKPSPPRLPLRAF